MNIRLPMSTREAIREFAADAPWGSVEELAEILDLTLDASREEGDTCDPNIGDDDMGRIMRGFAEALAPDPRLSQRIARSTLPDLMAMRGATMPEPRVRAVAAMGINPAALLMMASLIMDFEIEIEGGPMDGARIETNVLERGTMKEPGGRVVPVIVTPSLHWEEALVRIVGHQIPHVMMPHHEGRPLDDLVDHPLTRGLGLTVECIDRVGTNMEVTLRPSEWIQVPVPDDAANMNSLSS